MPYHNSKKINQSRTGKWRRHVLNVLILLSFVLGAGLGVYRFVVPRDVSIKQPIYPLFEAAQNDNSNTTYETIAVSKSNAENIEPRARTVTNENTMGAVDPNNIYWIKIQKDKFSLFLMSGNKVVKSYQVALGKNDGDKRKAGDMRTPEGIFYVERIQDSSTWVHDFKDGKGLISGAYGPKFIRLKTGWSGIGIHGTHDPSSIGKKVTEGCIRLKNEDLVEIVPFVKPGLKVQIGP